MESSSASYRSQLTYLSLLFFIFATALLFRPDQAEIEVMPDIDELVVIPEPISNIPDFAAIQDVQEKKARFFSFLSPYIEAVNQEILLQRQVLLDLREKYANGSSLSRNDMNTLSALRIEFELDQEELTTTALINRLLKRVDIIPHSLALAQAANESAWGTSRFAREGNNFFGQWCYTEGCGIVPSRRREGANHEVKSFDTVFDSVKAYIMNLNTFPNYQNLRNIRSSVRQEGRSVDGISLSEGLDTYSSRGDKYIFELQSMIYSNNLLELDRRGA